MLNRTNAPVRASGSDDKRIGNYRPIFSTGLSLAGLGLGDVDLGGLTFGGLGLGCLPGWVCLDPLVEPPGDVTSPVCRAVAGSRVEAGAGGRPFVTWVAPGAELTLGHAGRSDPVASAPDPVPPSP
jgi:hypothetical protein